MSSLSKLANNMFSKRNLFLTNTLFGVFFHVTGDLIAQKIENFAEDKKSFLIDYKRLGKLIMKLTVFNSSCVGPMSIAGVFYGSTGKI